jgi:NADH-quinone oxidoreductase subunit M
VQKVFYGKQEKEWQLPDLNFREITVMSSLIIVIVWLGLFPQQVFDISQKSVNKILNSVENAEVNNSRNVINYITAE